MKCFAGCTVENIVAAMGLTMADLFPASNETRMGEGGMEYPSTNSATPQHEHSGCTLAAYAAAKKLPIERMVSVTIGGQRRAFRVSDLPLGEEGIAGYAVDVEDMEELARSFRAFRDAQRSMLDMLSAGVAQFDAARQLVFANQPFQRIFALSPSAMLNPPPFERLLDLAHDLLPAT